MESPRSPPDLGEPAPAEAAWENLPEALNVAQTAHRVLLDQGLRLNRAFTRIKDPLIREAIVKFVADAARTQSGDAVFRAAGRNPKTGAR
jgi:hypothetical protein